MNLSPPAPPGLPWAQLGAVARMRWQTQMHLLRTRRGRFELAARIATTSFFSAIALAIAAAFAYAAFQFAAEDSLSRLAILFWTVMLLWQLLPLMLATAQAGGDLGLLLRFPVSFRSYALLYLCSGLFDLPSQMGVLCLLGIGFGASGARPALASIMVPALLLFALFNLLLTRMIFSWIEHWLARRRTREMLGLCFVAVFLSLQLINPAFHRISPTINQAQVIHAFQTVAAIQRFSPAGLTAEWIESQRSREYLGVFRTLGGMILYTSLAGTLLVLRLRSEFRGENVSETRRKQSTRNPVERRDRSVSSRDRVMARWLDHLVAQIVVKEVRYLSRSGVMLFGLITPILFLMVSGRSAWGDNSAFTYAFPFAIAYAFLPLTRQLCNSLGTEGAGVQLYFLSSTPFRTVMLAKNMLQAVLLTLEVGMSGSIAVQRFGKPDRQLAVATGCWLLFALPANLAAGNILSITMAYRMSLSRLSREQGSVGNALLSLAVQFLIFALGAAVYLPLAAMGHPAIAAAALLLLAPVGIWLWLRVLNSVDSLLNSRREVLMTTLIRAE